MPEYRSSRGICTGTDKSHRHMDNARGGGRGGFTATKMWFHQIGRRTTPPIFYDEFTSSGAFVISFAENDRRGCNLKEREEERELPHINFITSTSLPMVPYYIKHFICRKVKIKVKKWPRT